MTIALGQISCDQIVDMQMPYKTPLELFIGATAEDVDRHRHWLEPWALCPQTGGAIMAVQSYLLRTSHHTILVDTCVGCDKTSDGFAPWHLRTDTSWLDRLGKAGVGVEDVDFVFCTHLHIDHVGWNTQLVDGRWVPTFPNAKYVMSKADLEHAAANPDPRYHESVLPVIEAGQALAVEMDHALDNEIWLEPSPGHTPGHVCVAMASQGAEAVIAGDLIHSPLQLKHPDWGFLYDTDPDLATQTRKAFLDRHCETDRLVMTAHFPAPTVGHVIRDGDAYGFRFRGAEGTGVPAKV